MVRYCASADGYVRDFEDASLQFKDKPSFSYGEEPFIKLMAFRENYSGVFYDFFASQYFDNGIPSSSVQLCVIGPEESQTLGSLNEFSTWFGLKDRFNSRLEKVNLGEESICEIMGKISEP